MCLESTDLSSLHGLLLLFKSDLFFLGLFKKYIIFYLFIYCLIGKTQLLCMQCRGIGPHFVARGKSYGFSRVAAFYSKFHFCMKFLYEIDFHLKFYLRNCVMPISILFLLVKLLPYLSWFTFVITLVRTEFL